MPPTFDRDIERALREAGFRLLRLGAKHEVGTDGRRTVTVPRGIVSRHTANAILKQAGLTKAF